MNNQQGFYPSGFFIIFFSSLLAFIAFAGSKMFFILQDVEPNETFDAFVGVVSILFGIFMSLFILRKRDLKVTYGKAFVTGWLSTLVLGILTVLFYYIAFTYIKPAQLPENYIPIVLLKYNAFGMIFSAFTALIMRRD
jgi:hypothetical protein